MTDVQRRNSLYNRLWILVHLIFNALVLGD
jgi:hypothetical protein